ncbi:DUF2231 domain-containing protein [Sphingobium cupriresistens]|uniref:DUF2231 domain-containing protein n=1 Tax=Sphingobium cupriresistens TaxID=1132417 RepID=A0A8G1ZCV2_9SPHN|nr:DUF2231 domain-containing protein [Sphingobium cupriresistens]RYM06255.1 hypothetical protein EWH12_20410 [Sphingobium cupriresistens]
MPIAPPPARLLHPLHGVLLAWPVALFPAALLSDITYLQTAEIQWTNFSAWLITGALMMGAPVLLWAIVDALRVRHIGARRRHRLYLLLLAPMWIIGFVNALQHSSDGWSSVGTTGLTLSSLSAALALAAGWIAHGGYREYRP